MIELPPEPLSRKPLLLAALWLVLVGAGVAFAVLGATRDIPKTSTARR